MGEGLFSPLPFWEGLGEGAVRPRWKGAKTGTGNARASADDENTLQFLPERHDSAFVAGPASLEGDLRDSEGVFL